MDSIDLKLTRKIRVLCDHCGRLFFPGQEEEMWKHIKNHVSETVGMIKYQEILWKTQHP